MAAVLLLHAEFAQRSNTTLLSLCSGREFRLVQGPALPHPVKAHLREFRGRSHTQQSARFGHGACGCCRPKLTIEVKLFACSKVQWLHSLAQWRTGIYLRLALRRTGRASCQPSSLATRGMQFALMGAVHASACELTLLLSCTARALTTPRVCRIIHDAKKLDAEDKASKLETVG